MSNIRRWTRVDTPVTSAGLSAEEQLTLSQRVQGSNPCTPTNVFNSLIGVTESRGGGLFAFGRQVGRNRKRWQGRGRVTGLIARIFSSRRGKTPPPDRR